MSPLAADLSTLPRAQEQTEGNPPDVEPRFIGVLADHWATIREDDKPTAMGTRVRHSDAGKCARAIGYTAAGIPRSDPMDLTGTWNTSLGTLIHEQWQEALEARYPDAEVEVKVGHDDLDASGHIDAVIRLTAPITVIAYELKTVGGFAFKASVGKMGRGRPAEGPKLEHVLQAGLNARALGADQAVVGYLAKECLSVNVGKGMTPLARFAAEWTYTAEELAPMVDAEVRRLNGILALVDGGELPARKFPAGMLPPHAEIVDPSSGRWEQHDDDGQLTDTGTWWACGYCPFQTTCTSTPSGRIPIKSVQP